MPGLVRSMGPLSAQYTEDLHVFFPQSGYRSYKVRNIIEGHIKQAITIHVVQGRRKQCKSGEAKRCKWALAKVFICGAKRHANFLGMCVRDLPA